VDCGVSGSEKIIFAFLDKLGKNVSDITKIILTHGHPDHIGGAKAVKAQTGGIIAAHPAARVWVEDVDLQFAERPVPGFHAIVGGSVALDQPLAEGNRFDLGSLSLSVIHTPGHSRGSISLFCEEAGVLFSGDAIPQGNDLPIYDDANLAVASIRKLQDISGVKHLLASWADPQPDADPYWIMDNGLAYFQRIHSVIRSLPDRQAIKDPMTLCRIVVEKLGLPEVAVNPIVAGSLASHLPLIHQQEL
jgi:hypothetical protein